MRTEDELAFEAFVRASGPRLLYAARLLTDDHGRAEDVVQSALERVAQNWSRINRSPEAYARRAVANAAHDAHRRRRARPPEVHAAEGSAVPVRDATSTVDLRDELVRVLRELPQRQREVLVLRFILDLGERETADALGIAIGTVRSTGSRALVRLRELLHAPMAEPEGAGQQ